MNGARVLVGFAEALAAPESIWSLQDAGFDVHAFARSESRPAIRRMSGLTLHAIRSPREDAHAGVQQLTALLRSLRPDVVLPLDDAALWVAASATGSETGTVLAGPRDTQLRLALDKADQAAAAQAAGFRVPRTRSLGLSRDLAGDVPMPCIVKPADAVAIRDGRLVRDAPRICLNRSQLLATLDSMDRRTRILLQELVGGTGEGLFGLAREGRVTAWSAHRRVRMANPSGSGSSACVSIAPDPEARTAAERMLSEVGWNGLFMIEMLRDAQDQLWFVELNGRAWGSMALARRAGLEYPAWAVSAALGREPDASSARPVTGLRCRHLGREFVHLLFVLRGSDRPGPQWPGRASSVRDVLSVHRGDHWYNWRRGHAGLFVEDTVRTVIGAVTGRSS